MISTGGVAAGELGTAALAGEELGEDGSLDVPFTAVLSLVSLPTGTWI